MTETNEGDESDRPKRAMVDHAMGCVEGDNSAPDNDLCGQELTIYKEVMREGTYNGIYYSKEEIAKAHLELIGKPVKIESYK